MGAGAGEAAARLDHEFHEQLVGGCGNEQLLARLRPLKRSLLRHELASARGPDQVRRLASQHEQILAALERGDADAAARAVEANLRDSAPS
jgi:DNA-binding GntR family transcriptional regulator